MLAIRLTRTGKIHAPHYRIVVQEKRSKLNGKSVDTLGHYHPANKDKALVLDKEKAAKWLKLGAQPSDTVTNLLVKEGVLDASRKIHSFFTPTKKDAERPGDVMRTAGSSPEANDLEEAAAKKEVSAEAATETAEETPAEEAA